MSSASLNRWGSAVQKGDEVRYRSIAGPVYDAVTKMLPAGFVDIEVNIDTKEPVPVHAVRIDRIEPKCP